MDIVLIVEVLDGDVKGEDMREGYFDILEALNRNGHFTLGKFRSLRLLILIGKQAISFILRISA